MALLLIRKTRVQLLIKIAYWNAIICFVLLYFVAGSVKHQTGEQINWIDSTTIENLGDENGSISVLLFAHNL